MRLFLHRCVGATTSPPLSVASVLALGRESPSSASKLFGRTQMASSSLVAGAGQRFESARRLSLISIDTPDTRIGRSLCDLPGASLHHPGVDEICPEVDGS